MNDNHHYQNGCYLVLDIEFIDDPELYRHYTQIDPRPARRRWPLRRALAATVMALRVCDGQLEVEALHSFSDPAEDRLLVGLFECINQFGHHRLVTWGGTSTDVPILRVAAMAHGMRLPRQLAESRRDRSGRWSHIDLDIVMKHGAGSHVHMSEICVRIGAPVKFAGSAMSIPRAVEDGNYTRIAWLCDADVVSTAMIMAAQLVSMGDLISAPAAHLAIIRFVRSLRRDAFYDGYLGRVEARLQTWREQELKSWMVRVA